MAISEQEDLSILTNTISAATRSRRGRSATDPSTCFEVFRSHWEQTCMLMRQLNGPILTSQDDLDPVIHYLDQMISLLVEERPGKYGDAGPMLRLIVDQDLLGQTVTWSLTCCGDLLERLKLHLLKVFELLVGHCHQPIITHKQVLTSLFRLLNACGMRSSVMVERQLVCVLHQICVCLSRAGEDNQQSPVAVPLTAVPLPLDLCRQVGLEVCKSPLLILALLVPFVHRETEIGQQARDALLLVMALSLRNPQLAQYIALESDFCPVLATGLSALFSSLPRKLNPPSDDWQQIVSPELEDMPEMVLFLNSFDFCNAVIEVSHPRIRCQLLAYIHSGFLVPVLGSALHQSSLDEVTAATAYLDLFLRRVSQAALLRLFLKFVLTENHDDYCIMDSLINRINSNTLLGIVTLSFFRTLISFHCEDVMFHLIFKYLIPCGHLMSSQVQCLRDTQCYGKSAEKFLSLIPTCCISESGNQNTDNRRSIVRRSSRSSVSCPPNNNPLEMKSTYTSYLQGAHHQVMGRARATACWVFNYDTEDPPPNSLDNMDTISNFTGMIDDSINQSPTGHGHTQLAFHQLLDSPSPQNSTPRMSLCFPDDDEEDDDQEDRAGLALTSQEGISRLHSLYRLSYTEGLNDEISSSSSSDRGDGSRASSTRSAGSQGSQVFYKDGREMDKADTTEEAVDCNGTNESTATTTDTPTSSEKDYQDSLRRLLMATLDSSTSLEKFIQLLDQLTSPPVSLVGDEETASGDIEDLLKELDVLLATYDAEATGQEDAFSGEDKNREDRMLCIPYQLSMVQSSYAATSNIGPFLSTLLCKLESMPGNSLYVNLLVTGLVTDLAAYSCPLLKSLLLNTSLLLQPSVRSLHQTLASVRHRVDSFASSLTAGRKTTSFGTLLTQAKRYLAWRSGSEGFAAGACLPTGVLVPDRWATSQVSEKEPRRRLRFLNLFRRSHEDASATINTPSSQLSNASTVFDHNAVGGNNREEIRGRPKDPQMSVRTKNVVYCSIILEEFCKELSALAREHQVRGP